MSNYTQKFRSGTVYMGRLADDPRGPPLDLSLVGGIAPTLLGEIDAHVHQIILYLSMLSLGPTLQTNDDDNDDDDDVLQYSMVD